MRVRTIIRGRNCAKYLPTCLESLIKQTYKDWKATILLDAPTDKSYSIAKHYARKDNRIHVYRQREYHGVAYGIWKGIKLAKPKPEDIIAIYDGDDGLHKKAFEVVVHKYKNHPEILLTYGSYKRSDKGRRTKTSKKYGNRSVRKQKWHGSHLKTFKYKLFQHYPQKYLKDSKGHWFQAASDVALMLPLIELAGWSRTKFIRPCIYFYRRTSQRINRKLQKRNEKIIRNKKPLKMLGEL